mmetsp:Transcript_12421/g.19437  ORF Transcript_12421/g.19437 Transcript_12421/m.19437 type:complete len:188 (-) Transcript_12421:1091-1654(-)
MMILYFLMALAIIILIIPFLYLKNIVNSIYILRAETRQEYAQQNWVQVAISTFLGSGLIPCSMLVDILILPNLLMKPVEEFEPKYRLYSERLNSYQTKQTGIVLGRLIKKYDNKLKDVVIECEEIMMIHRMAFRIIDNLHDLICRGSKDYKKALMIVQDFNMSKILSKKFSVPDPSGIIKLAECELQ